MKTLLFSDSHGDVETMRIVAERELPDLIIHLGDDFDDAEALRKIFPLTRIISIEMGEAARCMKISGYTILLLHGETYRVDEEIGGLRNVNGVSELAQHGLKHSANIVLFGHSHEPYLNYRNGLWLMNPGRIGRRSSKVIHATYGLLYLEANGIQCAIREVCNS